MLDYAAILAVVFIIFFRAGVRHHRQRALDYRALAEALRVGVFWKLLGIGTEASSAPSGPPQRISVASTYPMAQPNELAWVQAALRGLDLADRTALSVQAPRVALDAYGWTREFWVAGQREFYRALEARCRGIAEQRQRWGILLLVASAALAAALSATDIYDEMTGRASTIMGWAERSAAFIVEHASFLPAGVVYFHQPIRRPDLSGAGFRHRLAARHRRRDRGLCRANGLQGAVTLLRADGLAVRTGAGDCCRSRIMSAARASWPGSLEPELSAHCQAIFAELGTAAMRSSAEWVAIHRDHVIG